MGQSKGGVVLALLSLQGRQQRQGRPLLGRTGLSRIQKTYSRCNLTPILLNLDLTTQTFVVQLFCQRVVVAREVCLSQHRIPPTASKTTSNFVDARFTLCLVTDPIPGRAHVFVQRIRHLFNHTTVRGLQRKCPRLVKLILEFPMCFVTT